MGNKKVLINTIDEFYNYNSAKGIKKHKLLSDLVYKNCQEISEEYDWLLSMSMNARYSNYQQDKIIASKARNLMNTIKSKCL